MRKPKAHRKSAAEREGRIPPRQRVHVQSLRKYLKDESRAAGHGHTVAAQERFAKRCGTSVQYLVQLALGIRKAQPAIAIRIEQASYGLVRAEDLCTSFDWHYAKLRDTRARSPAPEPPPPLVERVAPVTEEHALAA
jgi:DNA-binding transcriptional regulator YdaS (Cro superfamily)